MIDHGIERTINGEIVSELDRQGLSKAEIYSSVNVTMNDHLLLMKEGDRDQLGLCEALLTLLDRDATIKKDYIFGLLGFVDDEVKSCIDIDYSKTDADVFLNAMRVAVKEYPSHLMTLWATYDHVPRVTPDLPSWVVDFAQIGFKPSADRNKILHFSGSVRDAYMHHVDVACPADGLSARKSLRFRALRIDVVSQCATITIKVKSGEPIANLIGTQRASAAHEVTFEEGTEAWLADIGTIYGWTGETETSDTIPQCQQLFEPLLKSYSPELLSKLPVYWSTYCRLEANIASHVDHEYSDDSQQLTEEVRSMLREFLELHEARFVFKTASGRIGFANVPLSAGDQILLVPGGWRLYVVSADGHRYIGTTEVEGFMGDELVTLPKDLEDKWQIFEVW
jgi:hypothetical protein